MLHLSPLPRAPFPKSLPVLYLLCLHFKRPIFSLLVGVAAATASPSPPSLLLLIMECRTLRLPPSFLLLAIRLACLQVSCIIRLALQTAFLSRIILSYFPTSSLLPPFHIICPIKWRLCYALASKQMICPSFYSAWALDTWPNRLHPLISLSVPLR